MVVRMLLFNINRNEYVVSPVVLHLTLVTLISWNQGPQIFEALYLVKKQS